MTVRRLASAAAAIAMGSLVLAAPALAQENCPNPGGVYPPGQCGTTPPTAPPGQGGRVSDGSPGRGQEVRATTPAGSFDRGSSVRYGVQSTYVELGSTTAAEDGSASASLTVPTFLSNGSHSIVFNGLLNGQPNTVRLPITVSGGAALTDAAGNPVGGTTSSGRGVLGALPRTGPDQLVPLMTSGAALVVVGAGVVLVARRKRTELETTTVS